MLFIPFSSFVKPVTFYLKGLHSVWCTTDLPTTRDSQIPTLKWTGKLSIGTSVLRWIARNFMEKLPIAASKEQALRINIWKR
jgi:hypothetical protein